MSRVRKVDGFRAGGVEHRTIQRQLLADARKGGGDHELQFGAEQADAGGAGLLDMRQIDEKPGIDQK